MRLIFTFLMLIYSICALSQQTNSSYDKALADSLGADDYGMKMYVFVALTTGDVKITDPDSSKALMSGHLSNINKLVKEGKLIIAGPYGKNDLNFRGLFIFNSSDTIEVKQLLQTDPAIAAGVFDTEIIPWYGSAALPTYLPNHAKIEKTGF